MHMEYFAKISLNIIDEQKISAIKNICAANLVPSKMGY